MKDAIPSRNGDDITIATTLSAGMKRMKPKPHIASQVHNALQQYDSPVKDIESLRADLQHRMGDPLCNWGRADDEKTIVDPCEITSWFPNDDHVAFYAPRSAPDGARGERRYDKLTYKKLQEQIASCPPFLFSDQGIETEIPIVAIFLPAELMAEMALVILSTIACGAVAAPIDPRIPTLRALEAMSQLKCTHIVSTSALLSDLKLFKKCADGSNYETDPAEIVPQDSNNDEDVLLKEYLDSFLARIVDVRTIDPTPGTAGAFEWNIFTKSQAPLNTQSEIQRWIPSDSSKLQQYSISVRSKSQPAILLRTSGTTSTPKIVPITAPHMLFGSICIASSLELSRDDICCNAMPFYHIGGISCNLIAVLLSGSSIIHSGPFKDPNAFLDHLLLPESHVDQPLATVSATWYYAAPSMHKAVLFQAEARCRSSQSGVLPNKLRLIRNAAAHLNHDVALRMSKVFDTHICPTYGMSEAMPICSSIPFHHNDDSIVVDSVGYPIGNSIRIIDDSGVVLAHGEDSIGGRAVGEISVKGAGVIPRYIGLDVRNTHTPDGFLKTGDVGYLDNEGRLFIKGRTKEMIKRGGEQIWPNQIDDVVEKVPGVATAVAFGVPNELWGEEVAVAVILAKSDCNADEMKDKIMTACRSKLDDASVPRQIKFLQSQAELLRGPTGKYIRSGMASHLKVTAVELGALRAMKAMDQMQHPTKENDQEMPSTPESLSTSIDITLAHRKIVPSDALNGMRFITACFVVQNHVGQYPFLRWIMMQSFTLNMTIFFSLAGFQITSSVSRSVKDQWANFVGTKIGSLHALFFITQFISLPAGLIIFCSEGRCSPMSWFRWIVTWVVNTATGVFGWYVDFNNPVWFQAALYVYIILFPFLDDYFRRMSIKVMLALLIFSTGWATLWSGFLLMTVRPLDVFFHIYFTILNWAPTLLVSMVLSYLFRISLLNYYKKSSGESNDAADSEDIVEQPSTKIDAITTLDLKQQTRIWGYVADLLTLVILGLAISVGAASPDCICMRENAFFEMRPFETTADSETCDWYTPKDVEYVLACGVTHSEFIQYIMMNPDDEFNYGRWQGEYGTALGQLRLATPVILLWIYAIAHGNGITSMLFGSRLLNGLSTLSYPIYLLHIPVSRYYWIATRGMEPQFWWDIEILFPVPVAWYEVFIILVLTMVLGAFVNRFLVPLVMPYSVTLGVAVCTRISAFMKRIGCNRCSCCSKEEDSMAVEPLCSTTSTYDQVQKMVRGLTGDDVSPSLQLQHLGLDSLGATALLGMLRASVPTAKTLTMGQLSSCDTIGDLVTLLDSAEDHSKGSSSTADEKV